MASEEQFVHDLRHLLVSQRWQVAVACQEEIAGEIVPRVFGAAGDERLGVAPERRHPLDKPDLRVLVRSPPHEEQATLRTRLDAGNVLVGDAEHTEDDEGGQVPGQIANQVGPATRQALLDGSPGELPDERFHGGDASRGEGDVREPPHPGVRWGVTVRQRWDRPKAALCQEASCGGADRLQGSRVLAAENTLGVWKILLDIAVAGDDPVVEVGTVEDRGGGACLRKEGVRVGKVWIMEWIETLRETLCIAGPRFAHLGSFRMIEHFL